MNKFIRYIIQGFVLVVLFFTSILIIPSEVDHSTYGQALNEKKTNTVLLEESKEKIKTLEAEIESIKNEITTLNKDIETLSTTTEAEETPSASVNNSENNTIANGDTSKIHFIDTGNSDAILIQGVKNVLIDGGDNDDESMLVQYLKKQGIQKLDYMIATHPHADHIGGLDAVINALPVENLLVANGSADTKTYKDFINAASNKGLNPSVPLEGAKFELGNGAYMHIYNTNGGSNTNEQSLITLYVNGDDKALFTGDAESEAEKEVLDKLPDVDLLKVGHHGSKSSTTQAFLNKVNPEIAVITCGANNKYGHPHKETMSKLQSKGISVHRTDECGTIVFDSTGNGIKTSCNLGSFKSGN